MLIDEHISVGLDEVGKKLKSSNLKIRKKFKKVKVQPNETMTFAE